MKAVSAEDEMGKFAALCVKALLEFLGHPALHLFRLATALIGKIRGFSLKNERGPKQQESTARKGAILTWFQ